MPPAILLALVAVYGLALLLMVAAGRLRVPTLVALVVAGLVAGPAGLGIIQREEDVDLLAEVGIVLLLFTVGLDFSLAEVRRIWKSVVVAGTLQVAGTATVVAGIVGLLLGAPFRLAVFLGAFIALSSTVIVLNELSRRNQIDAPHGRLMVGVLLFQDLSIVLLLLLVPALSGQTSAAVISTALLRGAISIALVVVLARFVLPMLFRLAGQTGRREAFPLAVLLASLGTAALGASLGLSMAVGAFLAGLVLAESAFGHQAYSEVRPLRDILGSLFFISLGMLLNPAVLMAAPGRIALLTLAILAVKAVCAGAALLASGAPLRIAAVAGIGLAQIGEFSFVLGRAGLQAGVLEDGTWQVLLATSVITMSLTPVLLSLGPAVTWRLAPRAGLAVPPEPEEAFPRLSDHVIILGFGVGGHLVSRVLREFGIRYAVLDLNAATVRREKAAGEPIFYGDGTSIDTLQALAIGRARAVVVVISDVAAALRVVRTARTLSPSLPVIVRARYHTEARQLERAGATVAVAEELEASLEVVAQLLVTLDVPGNVVEMLVDRFRHPDRVRTTRAPWAPLGVIPEQLWQDRVATHQVTHGDWAVGRTLAELELRARTGAFVLAIRKGQDYSMPPSPDTRLDPSDVLYLVGDESDIWLARDRLTTGGRDEPLTAR